MKLQTCTARVDLIVQSRPTGVTSLAYNPVVHWEMVTGLHHLSDVRLAGGGVRCNSGRASIVNTSSRVLKTYLGPVPPPNMVVTPDAIASSAC